MKLAELYRSAIEMGMEADPRGREQIEKELKRSRKELERLEGKEKEIFDMDRLWNPYADSRILYGDEQAELEGLMIGVDITPAEVVLADRLREKGMPVSAILGHHPHGRAGANFYEVMHMQEMLMERLGVNITVAEGLFAPRIQEVGQAVHARNYNQTVDACSLLEIPFLCLHTPADNQVQSFLQKLFDERMPESVEEVVDILHGIPEYEDGRRHNAGPQVFVGEKKRRAGKVVVEMTGGTTGPKEMYEKLSQAGVGTLVSMHIPKEHIDEAKKHHINVVVAGHMPSDSLGMNLLADKFEEEGITIIPCSGYIRVKRS